MPRRARSWTTTAPTAADPHPERIDGDPASWARRVTPVILSSAPGYILQQAILPDFDGEAYLAALHEVLPGA